VSYETCFEEARPESWFVAASFYVDWRPEELPSILLAGSPEFTGLTDLFRGSLVAFIALVTKVSAEWPQSSVIQISNMPKA